MTLHEPLNKATLALKQIIDKAKSMAENDLSGLSGKPGMVFCPAIGIYADLLKESAVETLTELENVLKKDSSYEEIADEFWSVEDDWNDLLDAIDAKLNPKTSGKILRFGDEAPLEASLIDLKDPEQRQITLKDILLEQKESPKVHLVLLRHLS